MHKVLILLLLSLNLFANEILEIKKDFVMHNSSGYLYYIQDINEKFKATDILNSQNLERASKVYLTDADGPFWTKLTLKNSSEKKQFLSLYNPIAGTNYVDVYIFKNNKQITYHQLGDLQAQTSREEISRYSMFNLFLDKKEEVTIIARIKNYSFYNIGWNIEQKSNYTNAEILYTLHFGIFTGIAILFAFYNLFAYRIYRKLTYLIVSLNVLFILMYLHGVNGILYQVNIGINLELITAITWNTGTLIIIGLTLFPYYFFNLKKNYPKLKWYFRFKIMIFINIFLLTIYAQFFDESFFHVFNIVILSGILDYVSLIIIAVYMYTKKEIGSQYYLFGQSIFLTFLLLYFLVLIGFIPYFSWYKVFFPLGVTLDLAFFSFALYYKRKQEHKIHEQNRQYLLEQSKFSSMRQAIGNITHQWKHPLTQLGTSITLMQATLFHNKSNLEATLTNQLPLLQNNVRLMSNTLDEFSNIYSNRRVNKDTLIEECIQNSIKILQSKIILQNVTVHVDIKKDMSIYVCEHIFSNILLNLIDNSLDAFDVNDVNNSINITATENNKKLIFEYQDNAGGIKIQPIESIFNTYVSSKKTKENFGMGMTIVKMLVEERLFGNIYVTNKNNGVMFKIIIEK